MNPVVIIISADTEWKITKSILNQPDIACSPSPFGQWFAYQLPKTKLPYPLIFFHGGWGKIAAAASAQHAIDRFQPSLLINLGTCGGFQSRIERGDVILANQTVVYDIIEQIGDYDEHLSHYASKIDNAWLPHPFPTPVIETLLVSADKDLDPNEIDALAEKWGAVAGDWESGAIAHVAKCNNQRLLILRGVSDLVSAAGGEAYGSEAHANLAVFARGTRMVLDRLLNALPKWLLAIEHNGGIPLPCAASALETAR